LIPGGGSATAAPPPNCGIVGPAGFFRLDYYVVFAIF
jgi:hypothetical protein